MTRSNDLYAWSGALAIDRDYTANGLNQYSAVTGLSSISYDTNGNLTGDGTQTYVYDVENRLVSRSGGGTSATLRYDPLGRLYEVNGSVTGVTRFLYDGSDLVAEYNGSGTLLRRYVHGLSGGDDPLVWFEGSGVADGARRYLYADERGSIVAVTDSAGAVLNINSYDEYGIPGSSNAGRFQYTGQAWVPELGMYHYKARMYSPTLGRFMQTDPIGYGDGMNMYAYVGGDPVNKVDPTGMFEFCVQVPMPSQMASPITGSGDLRPGDILVQRERPQQYIQSCTYIPGIPNPALPQDNWPQNDSGNTAGTPVAAAPQRGTPYYGDTLCKGGTLGKPNFWNPKGRVNTGSTGGMGAALGDLRALASANGITPLSLVGVEQDTWNLGTYSPLPVPIGGGWTMRYNYRSSLLVVEHASGLGIRFGKAGPVRVDIPEGSRLPDGELLRITETCHYR